jgi:isopenicillin N synthase-like dioxygenase
MGYSDWDNDDRPAQHRDHDWQALTGDFNSIPIINVEGLRSDNVEERRKVASEIKEACTRVGFFYVENHGVPQELLDGVFQQAESFFALPFEQKMEVFIANSANFRGYTPIGASGKVGPDGKGSELAQFALQQQS